MALRESSCVQAEGGVAEVGWEELEGSPHIPGPDGLLGQALSGWRQRLAEGRWPSPHHDWPYDPEPAGSQIRAWRGGVGFRVTQA